MMRRILAIDPATRTGWAWSDGERLQWGVWALPKQPEQRGAALAAHIRRTAKAYPFDVLAWELATFGATRIHAMRRHNELSGVLSLLASELGVEAWAAGPPQWKATALGAGNATKETVQRLLRLLYGVECTDEDAADAIGILKAAERGPVPQSKKKQKRQAERELLKRQGVLFGKRGAK